eukprot:TRINITY_DN4062_c0_g4_i1.p1 TRINITY_DN4062_c0_g4~~TRINITY_DN4062_c0_g4_i1.p1  ORF type:complete len:477 (-),score=39.53 TRINITY_DN4062_c0_g4_i1:265-1695(-)
MQSSLFKQLSNKTAVTIFQSNNTKTTVVNLSNNRVCGRTKHYKIFSTKSLSAQAVDESRFTFDRSALKEQDEKVGVLLLNLGGPETLDDVQPFLYNLFSDPDIIRLPQSIRFLLPIIAQAISTIRAPKSSEGYKAIGGGSPLRKITQDQADALQASLEILGVNAKVYVAMRYWHPYTEEAVQNLKKDNVSKVVVLPLYPQFSVSTSGSSLRLLEQLFKEDPILASLEHTVIPSWYQRPGYVKAMADLIQQELVKFQNQDKVEIFFSAHGVPKSYVEEAGDPYKEEMEECIQLIMKELQRRGIQNHHTLAYQSRVGPVEWLKPYTDDSIKELAKSGVESLLAVPVSFVSEHIETLEEIDMEYRELALESGIKNWGRVPALNTNQVFIDDLALAVKEALPFVGSIIGPGNSLVPSGGINTLLETYDSERRTLPAPVVWKWGWTKSAETWNGRIAMIAVMLIIILEITTGQGVLTSLFL